MGLLARLSSSLTSGLQAGFGPSHSVGDERGWFVRIIGGGKTNAGVAVSEFSALTLPAFYACLNRIANPIARFPMAIYRPGEGGGSVQVDDHPLSRRLGLKPNAIMSSRTLRKTIQCHALTWGNGYCEVERNQRGQAVNLWPLMPWSTRPHRKPDSGDLVYRTTVSGTQYELAQDDVIHLMDMSQDGYQGLSQVALARQAIGQGLAMEEFGAKFFANDLKSGGFLMHPGKLSATAKGNLGGPKGENSDSPGALLERQGGLDNAHRVKVLEEGMKFVATSIPPEDAQFLGSREFNVAEIARIFDVPLVLLQSHEKTTSWGTGVEQLMIGFVRQTIDPWVSAWEQELNWKLFNNEERDAGYFVKFNMNAYLRGDSAARATFYKSLFELAAITPNQICALEDMDPIGPDGDHRFVSTNLVSLGDAINPPPAPETPLP